MASLLIDYNPYTNRFAFSNPDGSENKYFCGLETREHALSHRVDDIVEKLKDCRIDNVECVMSKPDFVLFEKKTSSCGIKSVLKKEYAVSKTTVTAIKKYYENIADSYNGYYEIIDDSGDSKIKAIQTHKKEIEELIKSYNEVVSDTIKLAFVSRYSSGKSYLINSIIGIALFEEDPGTTTQFIHELTYGEKMSLEYEYLDGSRKRIDVCSFKELTDNLAKLTNINFPLAKDLKIVHIEYPFKTSVLNTKGKYKIIFYDTPGPSANGYDTEKLYAFFENQRDTLPIFVLNENTIEETENKKIFKNMGADNFATAFRFVFFNKCDKLDNDTLPYLSLDHPKSLIEDINNGFSNPTIVCGSAKWYLLEKCNNIETHPDKSKYDNLQDFMVYRFNQIFEGEAFEDCCGVATLEDQINTYIENHAEYQKCSKAKNYLESICKLSKELYEELVKEEKSRKKKKIADFSTKIDGFSLTTAEQSIEGVCEIQKKQISSTITKMKTNLDSFYNIFKKENREEQQSARDEILRDYQTQLIACVSEEKESLKSEAIKKLNDILELIKKDRSVPVDKMREIGLLVSDSNEKIKSISDGNKFNLFKDIITIKFSAIHEMRGLLTEDKKTKKFKGKLKNEIQTVIEEFYLQVNDLYEKCKQDIKAKLHVISLIISGISDEIARIENYNKVICDVEKELQTCFWKKRGDE